VFYSADGKFNSGNGPIEVWQGCQYKSFDQLKEEGRTFDFDSQIQVNQLKA